MGQLRDHPSRNWNDWYHDKMSDETIAQSKYLESIWTNQLWVPGRRQIRRFNERNACAIFWWYDMQDDETQTRHRVAYEWYQSQYLSPKRWKRWKKKFDRIMEETDGKCMESDFESTANWEDSRMRRCGRPAKHVSFLADYSKDPKILCDCCCAPHQHPGCNITFSPPIPYS